MAIIGKKLEEGYNALILVRNTPISPANPYSVSQRITMIKKAYGDDYGKRVTAMSFPDFKGIAYGRGVGWEIEEINVSDEIKKISATSIRKKECDAMAEEVSKFIENQKTTFWFTGLPCSGKTTIAKHLVPKLSELGYDVVHLDGDDVREGLCSDLDFSTEGRTENLRRIAHLCEMHNRDNRIVLATFVSPTHELRDVVSGIVSNLKTIYVSTDLSVCEERDTKGMYAKARSGEIKLFTGISAPYECPCDPWMEIVASGNPEMYADDIARRIEQ